MKKIRLISQKESFETYITKRSDAIRKFEKMGLQSITSMNRMGATVQYWKIPGGGTVKIGREGGLFRIWVNTPKHQHIGPGLQMLEKAVYKIRKIIQNSIDPPTKGCIS